MKVKRIYYNGFVNFLYIPESDEEHAAMVDMVIRSEQVKATQEFIEELERKI